MNITFTKLYIQSFMSIGEAEIELQDSGYTLLNGINNKSEDSAKSNGSGKSSLWEALIWCLTGETLRGCKDVENIYLDSGCYVELDFKIDNDIYKVIRTKNHKKYKTNLFLYLNGQNVSGKGIRDTEKILHQYLPDLDSSLLGSVIILGQGLPTRFTNNSPSGRKEVLEKLSKSDFMIEELKKRICNRMTILQQQLRIAEDERLQCRSKIEVSEKMLSEIENSLSSLESKEIYQNIINKVEATLQELQLKYSQLSSLESEINHKVTCLLDERKKIQESQSSEYLELKNKYLTDIADIKSSITTLNIEIQNLNDYIKKAEKVTDICPTCGQRLSNVFKPDTSTQIEELKVKQDLLEKENSNLNILINAQNKELNQVSIKYKEDLDANETSLNTAKLELNDLRSSLTKISVEIDNQNRQKSAADANIKIIETQLEDLSFRKTNLRQDINDLNTNLIRYEEGIKNLNSKISIVRKFETVIKRDFRGHLLAGVIEYINKKAKEYSKEIFNTELIKFELNGNNISISYNGKEYEMLSGGEKQKIDLIIQFSIRDMLCEYLNFNSNLLVLDEIFDNLDATGCEKIVNTISKKLLSINSIYIISHHADELDIPADNYVTIIKEETGISRVKS